MVERRDRLWEILTMGLLRETLTAPDELRRYFSTLWTPRGRGAVHSLALIAWIDQNAWFEVGRVNLRQWSQTISAAEYSAPSGVLRHEDDSFEAFINGMEGVLGSGVRVADLTMSGSLSSDRRGALHAIGMVHPDAQPGHQVYFIQGCSIPVVLKPIVSGRRIKYRVIGGAYVLEADKKCQHYDSSVSEAWEDADRSNAVLPYSVQNLTIV
jgi:hypothetical protein